MALNALERFGYGLQGQLPQMMELERKRAEEEERKSALAEIMPMFQGQGVVPAQGYGPQQKIEPDIQGAMARLAAKGLINPSVLANYAIAQQGRDTSQARYDEGGPLRDVQLQQAQQNLATSQRGPERKVLKGADGFNYYQDTGERVLPEVSALASAGKPPATTGLPQGMMWSTDASGSPMAVPIPGAEKKPDMSKITVPGYDIAPGASPTPADANIMKVSVQAKKSLDTLIKEFSNMIDKYGAETKGSPEAILMDQKQAQINMQLKNLEDLGALQAPDIEILRDMVGSSVKPNTMFMGNLAHLPRKFIHPTTKTTAKRQMVEFKKYMEQRFNATLSTRGYVAKGETSDPLGLK